MYGVPGVSRRLGGKRNRPGEFACQPLSRRMTPPPPMRSMVTGAGEPNSPRIQHGRELDHFECGTPDDNLELDLAGLRVRRLRVVQSLNVDPP